MNFEISPFDKNINDLVSQIYDESQILELLNFDGSIDELNNNYPIECLRKEKGIYRAAYLGNECVVILLFDKDGNSLSAKKHRTQLIKNDFSSLKIGDSLEEVRLIDSDGEYLFLYTGRNDVPKVSYHYTQDGILITIEYNESNTIISINEELI